MANVIETSSLTKYYGFAFWKHKEAALKELTLTIPEGAVFGFLGPNGAGKTTTIKLLMDLIRPSSGEVKVFGKPPDDISVKQMIGFLPDNPAFSSYLSAYEFLTICAKLLKIPPLERRERIMEVLELVKMDKFVDEKLGGFSKGMIQRIGIAQAILNRPKLVILDEPLTGLDPHGRQELKDIILDQKDKGNTVFFSSHVLSDVEKICDSIGILNKGVMLCCGKLDSLLSVTGARMHIQAGRDDIAKELISFASGTVKLPDGSWELVFQNRDDLKDRINAVKEQHKDAVNITPTRENLEEFFFRKVENDRAII